MNLLKETGYNRADQIQFIDEYRLLGYGLNWGFLVLWDLTAKGNTSKIKFNLDPHDYVDTTRGPAHTDPAECGPQRSYELFDTKPFRVNPEAGIVVLKVGKPKTAPPRALVIPTRVFVASKEGGFLGKEIPDPRQGNKPKINIEWKKWRRFVENLGEIDPFFSFHNHVLLIRKGEVDGEHTRVSLSVYDFSLYSRRERDKATPLQKRPLALRTKKDDYVLHKGELLLDTSLFSYDHLKLLPTENGILVIKVTILMAAKRTRVLI